MLYIVIKHLTMVILTSREKVEEIGECELGSGEGKEFKMDEISVEERIRFLTSIRMKVPSNKVFPRF